MTKLSGVELVRRGGPLTVSFSSIPPGGILYEWDFDFIEDNDFLPDFTDDLAAFVEPHRVGLGRLAGCESLLGRFLLDHRLLHHNRAPPYLAVGPPRHRQPLP